MKVNAYSFAQLMKYLAEESCSCRDLAELTGLHILTVQQYTTELHKARVIHISGWEPDSIGRHTVKLYALGNRRDVKRPSMTRTEIARRYKEKQRRIHSPLNQLGAATWPN